MLLTIRTAEGIGILIKVLENNGYSEIKVDESNLSIIKDLTLKVGNKVRYTLGDNVWKTSTIKSIDNTNYLLENEVKEFNQDEIYKCYFSLWTGSESVEQRGKVLEIFNDNNYKYGQNCQILMTTSSGAEGISLMNVRQGHILEPYWNNVRIKQVIGRARRIKSHVNLPKDQQNVSVYNYIIKFSEEQKNGTWGQKITLEEIKSMKKEDLPEGFAELLERDEDEDIESLEKGFQGARMAMSQIIMDEDSGKTSDEALVEIAEKKTQILNEFLKLVQEAAIDCKFNREANIKSNPELVNLDCFTIIPSENPNEIYNYNLTNTLEYEKGISIDESLETVIENIKILKLRLTGNKIAHYIAFLPSDVETIEEYLRTESNTLDIYNYYTYYALDFSSPLRMYNKSKIGQIFLKGNDISHRFNGEFVKKIEYYLSIEDIITIHGQILPPKSEVEKIKWSSNIKQLHEESLKKNQWECVICDNTKYFSNVLICPKCNIGTPDMYETIKSQKSLVQIDEKPKPKPVKVKVKRFGRQKSTK